MFLIKHCFPIPAQHWVLRPYSKKRYPAKAIVGAAFGRLSGGTAWRHTDFPVCVGQANVWLKRLGFNVADGNGDSLCQVDRIYEWIIAELIAPARARGEAMVEFRAGEFHSALGPDNRLSELCNALRGRKLQQDAGVTLLGQRNPENETNTIYRFVLGDFAELDCAALEQRTAAFLQQHPGFLNFPDFGSSPDGARLLINIVAEIVAQHSSAHDAPLGAVLLDCVFAADAKFFSWMRNDFSEGRNAQPGLAEVAIGRLVRSNDGM